MYRCSFSQHPLSKIPLEQVEVTNEILFDRETITVYCDSSCFAEQTLIGVAACYVGDLNTQVESRKFYVEYSDMPVLAELKAISFAIEMLPKVFEGYYKFSESKYIVMYSDCDHIEGLINQSIRSRKPFVKDIVTELNQNLVGFNQRYNDIQLSVRYLGKEKKHNMFHRAAHNAARKVLS